MFHKLALKFTIISFANFEKPDLRAVASSLSYVNDAMLAVDVLPLIGITCLRASTLQVCLEGEEEGLDVSRKTPLV